MAQPSDPRRDLAGVLHDVSNALTVLLGWVGEARAPGATPEQMAYALEIVEQRARIARDLARGAIGAPRIDEQRALGRVAEDVAAQLRLEAERRSLRLEVDGDVAALVSGARDLEQVLTNLALNALAHAPVGTSVRLRVRAEEGTCSVEVADEGPGVARERRESIFRGDSLRPGGLGVGLRHARALARASGGDVVLAGAGPSPSDSELELGAMASVGAGACFRVTWPRADVLPRPPVSAARLGEFAGSRILVVEDDEAVSQLLEAALESRGAEVLLARSFADLAKRLASVAEDPGLPGIDAVLLDLSPISRDVAGAFALLTKLAPNALVVLVTGNADGVPAAASGNDVQLVRKPFEVREVLAVVATGLSARRAKRIRSESSEDEA